jgi:sodium pump decarboxylase gamma subunit
MLQQGLVLLIAGMGIAVSFLALLAIVTSFMGKVAPRWKLFPEPAPKKPAAKPATDDTAIAIAIAVANSRR